MPFLLFLILLVSCAKKSVYDITFLDLSGKEVRLKPSRKPLLLYVWSGTCTGHTQDLRLLNEHAEELSGRYEVVSVGVFMTPEEIRAFLKEINLRPRFSILADPKGSLTEVVKLVFLPATLVFSPEGELLLNAPRLPLERLMHKTPEARARERVSPYEGKDFLGTRTRRDTETPHTECKEPKGIRILLAGTRIPHPSH